MSQWHLLNSQISKSEYFSAANLQIPATAPRAKIKVLAYFALHVRLLPSSLIVHSLHSPHPRTAATGRVSTFILTLAHMLVPSSDVLLQKPSQKKGLAGQYWSLT